MQQEKLSCCQKDSVLPQAGGCSDEQRAVPSTTSGERTVVHMGAAVKGGGEQDGVNEETVGGRLGDGVQTHVCLHNTLCPDVTKRTAAGSDGTC